MERPTTTKYQVVFTWRTSRDVYYMYYEVRGYENVETEGRNFYEKGRDRSTTQEHGKSFLEPGKGVPLLPPLTYPFRACPSLLGTLPSGPTTGDVPFTPVLCQTISTVFEPGR